MIKEGKYYYMGESGIAKVLHIHGTRIECRYYYSDELDIYDSHNIYYSSDTDSWKEITPDQLAKLFLFEGDIFEGE